MHKARHTAGQRVLDATGNLKAVQKLLGHASIQTTGDIYTDWDDEQLAESLSEAKWSMSESAIVPHRDRAKPLRRKPVEPKWRRRESNPRPRSHRTERLRA